MAAGSEWKRLLAALTGGGSSANGGSGLLPSIAGSKSTGAKARGGRSPWSWVASPVTLGLLGLIGRSKSEPDEPAAEVEVARPRRFERSVSAESGWEAAPLERMAGERTRVVERPVQVTIQAMDSRSFLDRQEEIAAAVRRAVLESSGSGEIGEER